MPGRIAGGVHGAVHNSDYIDKQMKQIVSEALYLYISFTQYRSQESAKGAFRGNYFFGNSCESGATG